MNNITQAPALTAGELIALLFNRAEQINAEKVYYVVVTDRNGEVTVSITYKGKLVKGYPRCFKESDVDDLQMQLTGLGHYLVNSPTQEQGSSLLGRVA